MFSYELHEYYILRGVLCLVRSYMKYYNLRGVLCLVRSYMSIIF